MTLSTSGSLTNLGLACNPFKALFPEHVDPCRLVIVGKTHREALDIIVRTLIDPKEPSKIIIVAGKWGVGKTAVSKRAICDAKQHGVNVLSVYIQPILPVLSYDALLLEIARQLLHKIASAADKRIHYKMLNIDSSTSLIRNYDILSEYIKYCCEGIEESSLKSCITCFGGPNRKRLEAFFADRAKIVQAKAELKDLIKYIALRLKRPIYVIFDQFDELVNVDTDIAGQRLRDFLLTIKDIIHSLVSLQKLSNSQAKVVFVKSIISSVFMGKYSQLLENSAVKLEQLFGGHLVTVQLGPLESHVEVAKLLRSYIELNRHCVIDDTLLSTDYALFSENAIIELYKWSRGLPREILVLANRVVEEAGKIGIHRPISGDMVLRVAIKEQIGPIGEYCTGYEEATLSLLQKEKDPRTRLFNSIIDIYRQLVSKENENATNIIVKWSDRYLFIAKISKSIKNNYAVLINISKRIDKRMVTKMSQLLEEEIKRLNIYNTIPARKLVILLLRPHISREAQNLIYKLQREHNIVIEPIDLTSDAIARLVTTCILKLREERDIVVGELTLSMFTGMLEKGYRLPTAYA